MEQIMGIDLANENMRDMTAIKSMCSKCKRIIEAKSFKAEDNAPKMTVFIRCPQCGAKFDRHILKEY